MTAVPIREEVLREMLSLLERENPNEASYQTRLFEQLRIGFEDEEHANATRSALFEKAAIWWTIALLDRYDDSNEVPDKEPGVIFMDDELCRVGATEALQETLFSVSANWGDCDEDALFSRLDETFYELQQCIATPARNAWDVIFKALVDALENPDVKANAEAAAFAEKCLDMVKDANGNTSSAHAFEIIKREGRSISARNAAQQKNAQERNWVRHQWSTRADKTQSKNAFASQYRHLVKHEFGTDVTAETIKSWLPKINR